VGTADYWQDGYTQYKLLADSLVAGRGYAFPGEPPTAFRVPLYSLFVAAANWGSANPWMLIVAQALVSAGLVAIAGLIARRLYGPAAGLVAAAWCAAYPYFVWHDVSLQESGLFAALAALATLLLLKLRDDRRPLLALAAGAVLGLGILTRTTLVPFALLALGWLLLPDERRHPAGLRWRTAALAAAAILATLSPWAIRVHALTGAYGLGTETGQSLYAGAIPQLFSSFPQQSVDVSRARLFEAMPPAVTAARDTYSGGNPARESEWYTREAVVIARSDPAGYAARALHKLAIAFGPWPAPRHGLIGNLGYAVWWVPLLLLGIASAWRDRAQWRRNLLFAAHFAAFAAVTALVWAQTAHRAYLDAYLMVLAAPLVLAALPRLWRERLGG
jgi:4-amino-4-deoxy-L-arabinose transferase-like glycosyltransferase